MSFKYTDLRPTSDLPDEEDPLDDDSFLVAVWQVLVDNSPAIDAFILAYRDKPNIGYHNWTDIIQEIAAAVAVLATE